MIFTGERAAAGKGRKGKGEHGAEEARVLSRVRAKRTRPTRRHGASGWTGPGPSPSLDQSGSSGFISLKCGSRAQLGLWAPVAASGRAPLTSHLTAALLSHGLLSHGCFHLQVPPRSFQKRKVPPRKWGWRRPAPPEAPRGAPSDSSPVSEQSLPPLPPRRHCPCPVSLVDSIWTSSPDPG